MKKRLTDYDSTHNIKFVNDFTVFIIAGNYSVTGFEMILTRRMSHYMITYYLPSSLFVVVSWTSFLIPSEDIQGRMALLVTLFLVLVSYKLEYANKYEPVFFVFLSITYSVNYIFNISR